MPIQKTSYKLTLDSGAALSDGVDQHSSDSGSESGLYSSSDSGSNSDTVAPLDGRTLELFNEDSGLGR